MKTIDLTKLSEAEAIKIVQKDFNVSEAEAKEFVKLAQGKLNSDVVGTKELAVRRVLKYVLRGR